MLPFSLSKMAQSQGYSAHSVVFSRICLHTLNPLRDISHMAKDSPDALSSQDNIVVVYNKPGQHLFSTCSLSPQMNSIDLTNSIHSLAMEMLKEKTLR